MSCKDGKGKKMNKEQSTSYFVLKPEHYDALDLEVRSLCKVMNDLPGVHTSESCCGHGKTPFSIFFHVDENEHRGLFILSRSIDYRYFKYGHRWNITVYTHDWPETPLPLGFLLESTDVGKDAYTQAKAIADSIVFHRKHKKFLEIFGIQECGLLE